MGILIRIARWLHKIPAPKITPEQALAIAREECERQEWPWIEPVDVIEDISSYRIWTMSDCIGGNVAIDIDAQDGRVLFAGVAPI